ncbi:MAG: hypothetical protein CMN30_27160 [Sandaracinus sp.]|nr:hypothetical protein [Sandaracinus sp.]
MHVPVPEGGTRTLQIVCAVNVHTDPALKAKALDGSLHRTAVGELAEPYVFHDPEGRRFVLVVPEVLAHRLLHERAALLGRLADEARELPAYVAKADAVVGAAGLRAYLETPAGGADTEAREALARDQEAVARDREAVAAREAELDREAERLEALGRDVDVREQELEDRLEALREREAELLAQAVELEGEPTSAAANGVESLAEAVELVDDLEALDEEPLPGEDTGEIGGRVLPFPTEPEEGEVVSLDDEDEPEWDEPLSPLATSVLDDDDVELLDEELPPIRSELRMDDGPSHAEKRIPTPATPPAGFFEDPSIQMMATMADGPWLFVRLGEHHEEAFRGDVELLPQYIAIENTPVVLLALVEWSEPRPYARRAAMDPTDPDHRAILEALRDGATATAAIFGPAGRFERTVEVELGPRRSNLASVLTRADRDGAGEGAETAVVMERALAAPPPLSLRGHPFLDAPPAESAKAAREAVTALGRWSKPAKLDMAILALSIPRDQVDDAFRRILDDALKHGVAIEGPLVSRAVSLGVVAEPGEMVERLVDAFRGTSRLEGRGGFDDRAVADNWERLLTLAEEYEVALDGDAHEQAHTDIAAARPGSQAPRAVAEGDLGALETKDLVAYVEHPKLRRAAALELLSRAGADDAELVSRVVRAVRKMPREEVLDVMPTLLPLGEAAGGALIDTLGARKTFVRQAAALCLGELQMRRSIRPLVQALVDEPTEVWEEVARVLATFGRSIERGLRRVAEVDGVGERLAYLFAHLELEGEGSFLRKLASDENDALGRRALSAPAHAERARAHRDRVAGPDDVGEEDPIREFSRRFLARVGE